MSKVTLHQLTSGSFVVDKGTLNNRDWGVPYEHPNPMYVMEHPKGIVLFDTGMNHRGLGNPKEWWGETISGLEMRVKEKDCLPAQLASIGMKPQDVRYVVMSHLHIDHDDAERNPRVDLASCRRLGVRSILVSPLRHYRRTLGVFEVLSSSPCAFDQRDVATMQLLSSMMVAAISRISSLHHAHLGRRAG